MISIIVALLTRFIALRSNRGRMVRNDDGSPSDPSVPSYSEDAMEEDKDDSEMMTFDQLPLEVKEVIFLYLNPTDLCQCSLVSSKWNDVVNSNRVWLGICDVEALSNRNILDDSCSMIDNPMKNYFYSNERLFPTHWRSHYNRYRFVQKNWLHGYYALYRLQLNPIHVNEHVIVERNGSELIIYTIHGLVKRFCTVDVALPDLGIGTIIYKNNYLVYTQNRNVVCLKKENDSFREILQVALETGSCNQPRNNCVKPNFTLRVSDRFIVVQDAQISCALCFYETNDGSIRRTVDLHRALGSDILFCTCLEVLGDIVFLGYRMEQRYYIAQYDYSKDMWEAPTLSIPNRAAELHVNQNMLCAKICPDNREEMTKLYVWLRESQFKLGEYCANKQVPAVLTQDDMLIYSFRDEIVLRKLGGTYEQSFSVSPNVMSIHKVWGKFLVLHDEKGVSVWNSITGQKIVRPLRSESCISICVSDTNILMKCEGNKCLVVSYW